MEARPTAPPMSSMATTGWPEQARCRPAASIGRPEPVNISSRRTGSSSLDLSVSSEIFICRSPQSLRTSPLTSTRERWSRNTAYDAGVGNRQRRYANAADRYRVQDTIRLIGDLVALWPNPKGNIERADLAVRRVADTAEARFRKGVIELDRVAASTIGASGCRPHATARLLSERGFGFPVKSELGCAETKEHFLDFRLVSEPDCQIESVEAQIVSDRDIHARLRQEQTDHA